MYRQHFALKHYPFERTPHAGELAEGESQGEARARIQHLLDLRGIGLLTGEAGCGNHGTVCRQVAASLHTGLFRVCYVSLYRERARHLQHHRQRDRPARLHRARRSLPFHQ